MQISKNTIRTVAPVVLLLWAGCQGQVSRGGEVTVSLEPLAEGDIALAPGGAGLVLGADLSQAVNFEKLPVGLSWRLDGSTKPNPHVTPHVARSRQFRMRVSAAELKQGVDLDVTSPGAVIKLSSISPDGSAAPKALSPDDLVLTDAAGRTYPAVDAVELGATSDEFKTGEFPFAPGTTVLKTRPELGAGTLRLGLQDSASAPTQDILLHVYEPASDIVLELQSKSDAYLQGQELEVVARWQGSVTPKSNTIQGEVISPSGVRTPVQLVAEADGKFVGRLPLTETTTKPGELWEIEIDAAAEGATGTTRRTAKTAFAYALGTAALDPIVTLPTWPSMDELRLRFGVNVGSPGRYAITGMLYGTSAQGELVPFMVSQAAITVDTAGRHDLELLFEGADVAGAGLTAPYEIRDLRLLDQTRMGLLHRQARALVLPASTR